MARTPTYPLAQHPLDGLPRLVNCSLCPTDRAYLSRLMLENSLEHSRSFVTGLTLDVGCGPRPYEKTFFNGASRYIGLDYLSDRSKPDIISSALDLPFQPAIFDTVVCTEVLEHVPDPLRALKEMNRVLKPGGSLVLTVPLYWPRHEVPYDFYRYPYDGFLHLMQTAGFELQKLFSRGRSYAFLGQAIQHVQPISSLFVSRLINSFFLWCDRRLKHDALTLGWTACAKKESGRTNELLP
jgi:SAM-dependent methyltransferase